MNLTAGFIAGLTGAQLYGNSEQSITGVARIDEAQPGDMTFLYLPAYEKHFPSTRASVIIVKPEFKRTRDDITYLVSPDPNTVFYTVLIKFFTPAFPVQGIHPSAVIDSSAVISSEAGIGANVYIGPGVVVEKGTRIFPNCVLMDNVKVGSGCLLHPNVSVREGCILGNNVIIQPGAVIGSDGFGFLPDGKGGYYKIPQIGIVIIEDDVEIGANCTIDRAAMGATVIKKGTKLDNLVQIAHNVTVGANTVLSAQSGVAGSSKVGDNCIVAGQVGIAGHIEVTDKVTILAQSGVSKSITKPGMYFGYPAKEQRAAQKIEVHLRNLPSYAETLSALEKKVKDLEEKLNPGK